MASFHTLHINTTTNSCAPRYGASRALSASRVAPSRRRQVTSWRCPAFRPDLSDPDTLLGIAAAVVGLAAGIGFPIFMISRDDKDEERVEALRQLNKDTFEATGEYLSKDELAKIRTPRWTDRREYKDDD